MVCCPQCGFGLSELELISTAYDLCAWDGKGEPRIVRSLDFQPEMYLCPGCGAEVTRLVTEAGEEGGSDG